LSILFVYSETGQNRASLCRWGICNGQTKKTPRKRGKGRKVDCLLVQESVLDLYQGICCNARQYQRAKYNRQDNAGDNKKAHALLPPIPKSQDIRAKGIALRPRIVTPATVADDRPGLNQLTVPDGIRVDRLRPDRERFTLLDFPTP